MKIEILLISAVIIILFFLIVTINKRADSLYIGSEKGIASTSSTPENSFSYSKIYTKKVLAGNRIPVAVTCADLDDNGKKEIIIVNSYGITIYKDVTFEE